MGTPYLGEIRMFGGNFAPQGWAFCNGQVLSIAENDALFTLIGTTYGGDGESTFALPDLRGRRPIHQGVDFILAETGGAEEITLTANQVPAHTHALLGSNNLASSNSPSGNVFAATTGATIFPYGTDAPLTTLHPSTVGATGGSQPHTNFHP